MRNTPSPLLDLMWRYCVPYTNAHDLSQLSELMVPDYVLHMGAHHVWGRDGAYRQAVAKQFRQFPHLALTVHRIVTDGSRLAMAFSEHGSSVNHDGRAAVWRGIALYRWDGSRLVECFVEQDYYARARQLRSGVPDPVSPPAVSPWSTTALAPDESSLEVVRAWLGTNPLLESTRSTCDDSDLHGWSEPVLDDAEVTVRDIFSCGNEVPFSVEVVGRLSGGMPELSDRVGSVGSIVVNGIATVNDGSVSQCQMVADRLGFSRSLRPT